MTNKSTCLFTQCALNTGAKHNPIYSSRVDSGVQKYRDGLHKWHKQKHVSIHSVCTDHRRQTQELIAQPESPVVCRSTWMAFTDRFGCEQECTNVILAAFFSIVLIDLQVMGAAVQTVDWHLSTFSQRSTKGKEDVVKVPHTFIERRKPCDHGSVIYIGPFHDYDQI